MANVADYQEKLRRVHTFLDQNGYGFLMLQRRDNFAWFTSGGDNKVFRSSEYGVGILLIGHHDVFYIAQFMDVDRVYDDELDGLGIQKISWMWFEASPLEKALEMAHGQRVASDFHTDRVDVSCEVDAIYALHYPMTDGEVDA